MHPLVFWIASPLLSAACGYLLWQAMKTRGELLRMLGDEGTIARLLDGRDWRKAALTDKRVRKALRDMTQLSINTPILFRSFELDMLRVAWMMTILILAIAAASAVLASPWLILPVVIAAGCTWYIPLHPLGLRKAGADLTALAMSLHLWYEYDAEICESVNSLSPRFEKLFGYVKAHFPENKHAVR